MKKTNNRSLPIIIIVSLLLAILFATIIFSLSQGILGGNHSTKLGRSEKKVSKARKKAKKSQTKKDTDPEPALKSEPDPKPDPAVEEAPQPAPKEPSKPKVNKPPVYSSKMICNDQALPFQTINQDDPNLEQGKTVVSQSGASGLKRDCYLVKYQDGQEISRQLSSSEVIKQPVNKIVKVGTKPPQPSGTFNYAQASQVLTYVNQERAAQGLPALVWNNDLAYYARIRAGETVTKFDHIRPNGQLYYSLNPGLINGENLVAGTPVPVTAAQAVQKWMQSPAHRANILEARFKSMGAAYLVAPSGLYKNYWVQLFSVQ